MITVPKRPCESPDLYKIYKVHSHHLFWLRSWYHHGKLKGKLTNYFFKRQRWCKRECAMIHSQYTGSDVTYRRACSKYFIAVTELLWGNCRYLHSAAIKQWPSLAVVRREQPEYAFFLERKQLKQSPWAQCLTGCVSSQATALAPLTAAQGKRTQARTCPQLQAMLAHHPRWKL